MTWWEDKQSRWADAVRRSAGEEAAREVLRGSGEVPRMTLPERAEWVRGALARLENRRPDEEDRRRVMLDCGCRYDEEFGEEPLRTMRDIYRRTVDLGAVIAAMLADRSHEGHSIYPPYTLEGGAIRSVKRPRDPAAYTAAETAAQKRIAACFCPLVREAVPPFPAVYCYCSAGWEKRIWETILERPVTVTVTGSVLQGDENCSFLITPSPLHV